MSFVIFKDDREADFGEDQDEDLFFSYKGLGLAIRATQLSSLSEWGCLGLSAGIDQRSVLFLKSWLEKLCDSQHNRFSFGYLSIPREWFTELPSTAI